MYGQQKFIHDTLSRSIPGPITTSKAGTQFTVKLGEYGAKVRIENPSESGSSEAPTCNLSEAEGVSIRS